jgi:hypothetical protein
VTVVFDVRGYYFEACRPTTGETATGRPYGAHTTSASPDQFGGEFAIDVNATSLTPRPRNTTDLGNDPACSTF